MTKVRKDKHGPYVKAGGYVFRPVFPLGYSHVHKDGTHFKTGDEVRAQHQGGTPLASVRRADGDRRKETWFSHGAYLGDESNPNPTTESLFKPAHETWESAPAAAPAQPVSESAAAGKLQKVVFLSRERAEMTRGEPGAIIVSIHDASEPPAALRPHWAERLTLKFHDTSDSEGVLTPYTAEDARQVLQLVLRHRDSAPAIYVHCRHGQSRSAGIALALSQMLGVPCFKHREPVTLNNYHFHNRAVYITTLRVASDEFAEEFF